MYFVLLCLGNLSCVIKAKCIAMGKWGSLRQVQLETGGRLHSSPSWLRCDASASLIETCSERFQFELERQSSVEHSGLLVVTLALVLAWGTDSAVIKNFTHLEQLGMVA